MNKNRMGGVPALSGCPAGGQPDSAARRQRKGAWASGGGGGRGASFNIQEVPEC